MPKHLKVLILAICLSPGGLLAIEEPRFTVEVKTATYEIRKYDPIIVAETTVAAPFEDAGNRGFRLLADYIFGNNRSRAKLAMTAPVTQQVPSEKLAMTAPVIQAPTSEGFLIQFTMPSGFTLATLPEPNNPQVRLRELPARRVAVLTYSGSWSEDRYQAKLKTLLATLQQDGLRHTGPPVFARFNSPFQLPFLRRNELWIEVVA